MHDEPINFLGRTLIKELGHQQVDMCEYCNGGSGEDVTNVASLTVLSSVIHADRVDVSDGWSVLSNSSIGDGMGYKGESEDNDSDKSAFFHQ